MLFEAVLFLAGPGMIAVMALILRGGSSGPTSTEQMAIIERREASQAAKRAEERGE